MAKIIRVTDDNNFPLTDIREGSMHLTGRSIEENEDNLYSINETYTLSANNTFTDLDEWQVFIDSVFPASLQNSNHNAMIPDFQDSTIEETMESNGRQEFFRIENEINYQNALQYFSFTQPLDEKQLPLIYTEFVAGESNFIRSRQSLPQKPNVNNFKNFREQDFTLKTNTIIQQSQNILFSCDYKFTAEHKNKEVFPMYNKINFSTETNSDFLDVLEEFNFYTSFVNHYIKNDKTPTIFSFIGQGDEIIDLTINTVDVMNIVDGIQVYLDNSDKLFLPQKNEESHFSRNIKKYACFGRIRDLSKTKNRNFSDIVLGKNAEHEFLFYKVDKYVGETTTNISPVSSFWCSSKRDIVNLIDTQIKPQQTYTYAVTGYCIIFGSSYSINSTNVYERNNKFYCDISTSCSPSFQMLEIPLFRKTISAKFSAPLPPYVQFMNQSNSKKMFKLFLDVKNGSSNAEFISIEQEDDNRILLMRENSDATYSFEYTKERGQFQIFKLPRKPASIYDFATVSPIVVSSDNASAVIHREMVLPNKKYYYMFRTLSNSGLVSNPSPVYEVELLQDAEKSKVVTSVVHFSETDEDRKNTVLLRRLLKIEPAADQIYFEPSEIIDSYNNNTIDRLKLGTSENGIWGRKFKIRLKSNATGKKIDINLLFRLHKTKSSEHFS